MLSSVGALAHLMAGKPRRRREASFQPIPDQIAITLGTLADDTVILQASGITLTQDYWQKSLDYTAALRDLTAGEGPIWFGIADPELTVAEIKEALNAVPTSSHDFPAVEHARRPVRVLGVFDPLADAQARLNEGKPKRFRFPAGWTRRVPAGKQPAQFWAWNRSGAALTTGGIIQVHSTYYGNWR